jgi:DNA-binding NarL/FixJ family response regulator
MKRLVRILIADDQVIVRNGIRFMLENQEAFIPLIDEVTNGAEVLDMVYKNEYDIILMDVEMPKMNGISAIGKLREKGNDIPILVLSVYDDEMIVKQVLEKGSNGYIMKDAGTEELVRSIETILGGDKYFGNAITQVLLGTNKKKSTRLGLETELTKREFQVLKLIAEERNHDDIAAELKISRRTVEGHKKNLTTKLHVKGSVGLVKYAMNNGVI